MKMIIALAALVAVAFAAPPPRKLQNTNEVVLLKEVPHNNIGLEGYKFSYELSDGQSRDEVADVEHLKGARTDKEEGDAIIRVRGSFSYVNPHDGQTYSVKYVADEHGFKPEGAHLPKVA